MTTTRRYLILGLLAGALVSALGHRAHAQTPAELQRAKESFQAGAAAYAAGEYLAAIQALDTAYGLTPLPAIAFSLAQAERRQYFVGRERPHLDRAITLFRRYLEQVATGGRRADALDALSQLEPLAALSSGGAGAAAGERPGGAAARPTRLMISAEAPGARLAVDDEVPAPSPVIREVPPGKHRVKVTADGFFPEEREVTAVAGELVPVTVALRERPSTLSVSAPRDAELYLDGVFVRRGGSGLRLTLPSGPHRLSVAEKGHRVVSRSLVLAPGGTQDLVLSLPPTGQRRAARLLIAAGGVFLGGSAIFGGLALRAQDQAQQFLDRRMRGSVSRADLEDYDAAVTSRNRFRLAAASSLALTAGALITGLFLHEFDRATPEELQRAEGAATALQVDPLAGAGQLGASVRARF